MIWGSPYFWKHAFVGLRVIHFPLESFIIFPPNFQGAKNRRKKKVTSGARLIHNENSPSIKVSSFEIHRNHIPNIPRYPAKKKVLNSSIPNPKIIPATKPKLHHAKLHTSQAQQWEAKALAQQLWSLSWPCHPKTVPSFSGRSRDPKGDFLHKNAAGRWTCNGLNRYHSYWLMYWQTTNINTCMIWSGNFIVLVYTIQ